VLPPPESPAADPSAQKRQPAAHNLAARLHRLKDKSGRDWDVIASDSGVSRSYLLEIAAGRAIPSEATRKKIRDYFAQVLKKKRIQF
jgi:hypothetical protein